MATAVMLDHWATTRQSLERATKRFAELLSDVDGGVAATPKWTVADTAAHVATIARLYTAIVRGDGAPLPYEGIDEALSAVNVDSVADLNETMLRQVPERDPRAIANRLNADVAEILRASEAGDPAAPVSWLGGAHVPLAGVLAHLLNEIQFHGFDIARATGAPWTISTRDVGLFFELFVIGMARHGLGRLLDSTARPPRRRVTVEFRSDYTSPAMMVLQDHRVFVEEPAGRPDVILTFDPATLGLMLFGRISKPRALLSGKLSLRGRRPWLLPVFMRTVRFPA
jgi:hypothetical protein